MTASENREVDQNLKHQLWDALRAVQTVDDIFALLERIDDLEREPYPQLSRSNLMWMRRHGFNSLRELTTQDFAQAHIVILEQLLPYCLRPIRKIGVPDDSMSEVESHYLRELLSKWIDGYLQVDREPLRQTVIDRVCEAALDADIDQSQAACRTLGEIGFRSSTVVQTLGKVATRFDEAGDAAFSNLVGLGVPNEAKPQLMEMARDRLAQRPFRSLAFSLGELADPALLEGVLSLWNSLPKSLSEENNLPEVDFDLGLSVLSRFADRLRDDPAIQDRIWAKMLLADCSRDQKGCGLLLGSNLAPRCDSPNVIPDFLTVVLSEDRQRHRHLAYLRMGECARPRHQEGWVDSRCHQHLAGIEEEAQANTNQMANFSTLEMEVKQESWRILFRMGREPSVDLLDEAVRNEVNGHVRGRILQTVACFPFPKLPAAVSEMIRKEQDIDPKGEYASYELSALKGAELLARSVCTRQSFLDLLDFGYTFGGHELAETIDALGEVAIVLVSKGDETIVPTLLAAAQEQHNNRRRTGAIGALRVLSLAGYLPASSWASLTSLSEDLTVDPYLRSLVVEAVGFLSDEAPTGINVATSTYEVLARLTAKFANSLQSEDRSAEDRQEDEVVWRAVEGLVRHGTWKRQHDSIIAMLGMKLEGNSYHLPDPEHCNGRRAFLMALLYRESPGEMGAVIQQLIQKGHREAAYQTIRMVAQSQDDPNYHLPQPIERAIVDRAHSANTGYSSELYLFGALAVIAPWRLVREPWQERWDDWLPNARTSLANAFLEIQLSDPEDQYYATVLLRLLMSDGSYAVRRAACRALAKHQPKALISQYVTWALDARSDQANPSIDERKRAAEVAAWIDEPEIQFVQQNGQRFSCQPLDLLLSDPEPSVREVAKRVSSERRDRVWADDYLGRILNLCQPDFSLIAWHYRYGCALEQVGDDYHKLQLEKHIENPDTPLPIKHWFSQIANGVDKHWRKVTEKWPEPWIAWQGIVEEVDGAVSVGDKRVAAHFSLWYQPSTNPRMSPSWRGTFWMVNPEEWHLLDVDHAMIELPSRQPRSILITTLTSNGLNIFVGNDHYPEE